MRIRAAMTDLSEAFEERMFYTGMSFPPKFFIQERLAAMQLDYAADSTHFSLPFALYR